MSFVDRISKTAPPYAMCIGTADIWLVLLNLHFISDVVAGTFVGASTGLFTVVLFLPNARLIERTKFDVAVADSLYIESKKRPRF